MTTRFKTGKKNIYGEPPIPTGYEKSYGTPSFFIPSCGVEDVDRAVFNLFDKEINLSSIVKDENGIANKHKKVPVIFASAEKWAQIKRNKYLRDKSGTIILPIITISREISQENSDIVSRGISPYTGEIIVKRRIDKSDREYQRLINRIFLPNQDHTAIQSGGNNPYTTERTVGDLASTNIDATLIQNRMNSIFETIVIPSPQFYVAKYVVEIICQYFDDVNSFFEQITSSILPQGRSWRVETEKGYWFVAQIDDGSPSTENNFDDMTSTERTIKLIFNLTVPAFTICTLTPGAPVPIKRYVSSPTISFEVGAGEPQEFSAQDPQSEYVLGSDDPTLPLDEKRNNRTDQRTPGWRIQKTLNSLSDDGDPALSTLPRGFTPKIRYINKKGETVYTGGDINTFTTITSK